MKILTKQLMAERKIGTGMAAILAPLLAACGPEAGAQQVTQADRPGPIQVAAVTTETRARTMDECRALADKTEKIACMTEARDALRAENAAMTQQREENAETIAMKRDVLETEQEANEQRRTTVAVLTNILEESGVREDREQ